MNIDDLTTAQYEGSELEETPAVRDAIAGLTGNLGVDVRAWQLEARRAIQYAEYHAAATAGEQREAVTAARGEGRP